MSCTRLARSRAAPTPLRRCAPHLDRLHHPLHRAPHAPSPGAPRDSLAPVDGACVPMAVRTRRPAAQTQRERHASQLLGGAGMLRSNGHDGLWQLTFSAAAASAARSTPARCSAAVASARPRLLELPPCTPAPRLRVPCCTDVVTSGGAAAAPRPRLLELPPCTPTPRLRALLCTLSLPEALPLLSLAAAVAAAAVAAGNSCTTGGRCTVPSPPTGDPGVSAVPPSPSTGSTACSLDSEG